MSNINLDSEQILPLVVDPTDPALRVKDQTLVQAFDVDVGAIKTTPISGSLVTDQYDYISLAYSVISGQTVPTTVVYKLGGSGGTTVATLTLGYDGSANLTSVTKA